MKENNKFSLSAFFCSLGSKSRIFMFFLLGAPFLLVQIFTLKVYANSAVIPVVPEGLTSSGITSNGIVPGDPSLLYYTVLIALGLKADEVYQVNKSDIIDSVTDSLNEYDSVNDPSLGNDLESYLEWVDNAKSQNGYVNELSIPRSLWNRLNKATSNGLNLRISNNTIVNLTKQEFWEQFCNHSSYPSSNNVGNFSTPCVMFSSSTSSNIIRYQCLTNSLSNYIVYQGQLYFESASQSSSERAIRYYSTTSINSFTGGDNVSPSLINGTYYYMAANTYYQNPSVLYVFGSASVSNKSIGVARPFITSKANNTFDVLSKSGVINDSTGELEGDVTMSVLSPDKLKDIASDYEDVATDIPVFFPDSRLVPIDIENPNEIPDSVGIPGDTPQEIIDSLADTVDPSPAEPIVIQPFNYIDQWDPFIPDPTPETPLVGLSAVMNWLAEQMQTTMYLTQFSNCWLVLSTLVVAACLIGLVRIWR